MRAWWFSGGEYAGWAAEEQEGENGASEGLAPAKSAHPWQLYKQGGGKITRYALLGDHDEMRNVSGVWLGSLPYFIAKLINASLMNEKRKVERLVGGWIFNTSNEKLKIVENPRDIKKNPTIVISILNLFPSYFLRVSFLYWMCVNGSDMEKELAELRAQLRKASASGEVEELKNAVDLKESERIQLRIQLEVCASCLFRKQKTN